jgi:hypothetical protein
LYAVQPMPVFSTSIEILGRVAPHVLYILLPGVPTTVAALTLPGRPLASGINSNPDELRIQLGSGELCMPLNSGAQGRSMMSSDCEVSAQ